MAQKREMGELRVLQEIDQNIKPSPNNQAEWKHKGGSWQRRARANTGVQMDESCNDTQVLRSKRVLVWLMKKNYLKLETKLKRR